MRVARFPRPRHALQGSCPSLFPRRALPPPRQQVRTAHARAFQARARRHRSIRAWSPRAALPAPRAPRTRGARPSAGSRDGLARRTPFDDSARPTTPDPGGESSQTGQRSHFAPEARSPDRDLLVEQPELAHTLVDSLVPSRRRQPPPALPPPAPRPPDSRRLPSGASRTRQAGRLPCHASIASATRGAVRTSPGPPRRLVIGLTVAILREGPHVSHDHLETARFDGPPRRLSSRETEVSGKRVRISMCASSRQLKSKARRARREVRERPDVPPRPSRRRWRRRRGPERPFLRRLDREHRPGNRLLERRNGSERRPRRSSQRQPSTRWL